MLVRSVKLCVQFCRICGNESQPGLQLVKRLAMPLVLINIQLHKKQIIR